MSRALLWLLAFALTAAILIGVGQCKDGNATVNNAVAKERVRVIDSVTKAFEPIIDSLSADVTVRVDTVRRSVTRWDTVTRARVDTVFATDSSGASVPAVPLPQYEAVVLAGDSLKRSCSLLAQSCEALRDSVPKLVDLYRKSNAARDSVIANPPPPRRYSFSLCATAGPRVKEVTVGPSLCYRLY